MTKTINKESREDNIKVNILLKRKFEEIKRIQEHKRQQRAHKLNCPHGEKDIEKKIDLDIQLNFKYFDPDYYNGDLDFDDLLANIHNNEKILKS